MMITPAQLQTMEILAGSRDDIAARLAQMSALRVDEERRTNENRRKTVCSTLARSFCVTGIGTYCKETPSTLEFLPSQKQGWWFERTDLPGQLPIAVTVRNVLSANRNITLHSGAKENFVRMTEHIIAQRLGMCLDNVLIRMNSFDPPLFDDGSLPIASGIADAGLVETSEPLDYFTVSHPVAMQSKNGGTLIFLPPESPEDYRLTLDVAIDFSSAIGKQRLVMDLTPENFLYGSQARTNAPWTDLLLVKTVGKFSSFWRNIGYTKKNILITGKKQYVNAPGCIHDGKSLEAVWHRTCEDLVAALSLLERGRLTGRIISYKSGHQLDVDFMTALVKHDLLVEW